MVAKKIQMKPHLPKFFSSILQWALSTMTFYDITRIKMVLLHHKYNGTNCIAIVVIGLTVTALCLKPCIKANLSAYTVHFQCIVTKNYARV